MPILSIHRAFALLPLILMLIGCYDRTRVYPASPATLTYPVPCLGQDW